MEFYRYIDPVWIDGSPQLETLYLVRETKCGYWISYSRHYREEDEEKWFRQWAERKRWISKTTRKRFAYPTKEEALFNYLMRKYRAVQICRGRLEKQERMLEIAKVMHREVQDGKVDGGDRYAQSLIRRAEGKIDQARVRRLVRGRSS